jgi:hypothetical protein
LAIRLLGGVAGSCNPRLWKMIISPEFGKPTDRELRSMMEKDPGTRLEWVAVPHFNPEHLHVNLALGGNQSGRFSV